MKKVIFLSYLVISLTLAGCIVVLLVIKNCTESAPGNITLCTMDGVGFVSVFIAAVLASILYIIITAVVLRILDYKITKR